MRKRFENKIAVITGGAHGIGKAIDAHHASPMMTRLAALREKYDLHMTVERFVSENIGKDEKFIRQ